MITASQAKAKRAEFVRDVANALRALAQAGLTDKIPALSVIGKKLTKMNDQLHHENLPWKSLDEFREDVERAFNDSGSTFDLPCSFLTSSNAFCEAIDEAKRSHRPLRNWDWGNIKSEFNKKELIRQTDSLIRDLVKAIGNDNNRLTDVHLMCAIVGKLHQGGDTDSNIWKEAAKLYTKESFVKFFKDLLDHCGRVHNASYTDLPDLVKVVDWQLDNHPALYGGKQKWGVDKLAW